MTEAAFGRFTYNQYEGTSILAGGRKVEVLLPPVTLSLGVVQNRKNEWLEVEVLQYGSIATRTRRNVISFSHNFQSPRTHTKSVSLLIYKIGSIFISGTLSNFSEYGAII